MFERETPATQCYDLPDVCLNGRVYFHSISLICTNDIPNTPVFNQLSLKVNHDGGGINTQKGFEHGVGLIYSRPN